MTEIEKEEARVIGMLEAIIQAFGPVVGRNVEIVLHDLRNPARSVIAIANGHLTNRTVGSPVLGGPEQDQGFAVISDTLEAGNAPVVMANYATVNSRGTHLRSSTVAFRNSAGQAFAGLCINSDFNDLEAAQELLKRLAPLAEQIPQPSPEPGDLEVLSADVIQKALDQMPKGKLNKAAKIQAVRLMQDGGLFIVKGGVERAADALGVSRFSIYNYLEEIRNDPR